MIWITERLEVKTIFKSISVSTFAMSFCQGSKVEQICVPKSDKNHGRFKSRKRSSRQSLTSLLNFKTHSKFRSPKGIRGAPTLTIKHKFEIFRLYRRVWNLEFRLSIVHGSVLVQCAVCGWGRRNFICVEVVKRRSQNT